MRIPARSLIAIMAALGMARVSGAQTTYLLRRTPTFRPGDKVTCMLTGKSSLTVTGQSARDELRRRQEHLVQEVLTVDPLGRATSFRTTVLSASETTSSTTPAAAAYRKTVALADLHAEATRTFGTDAYRTDPATLAVKDTRLGAAQVALIKKVLPPAPSFFPWSAHNAALLPKGPVSVGHVWSPPGGALTKWAESNALARRMRARVVAAQCKLSGVADGVATVQGVFRLRTLAGGKEFSPLIQLTATIHLASGRWTSETYLLSQTAQIGRTQLRLEGHQMAAYVFQAGSGTASGEPAGRRKLGWTDPGPDKNSFRDASRGVSLDVPKDYDLRTVPPGDMIARFANPGGGVLTVSLAPLPRPTDLTELLPTLEERMRKSGNEFRLRRRTPMSLPGNVPAMLLEGVGLGGKAVLIRLVALDDRRLVSLDAAAPAAKPQVGRELLQVVRTLRLFEPVPPEPKRDPKTR